MLCLSAFRPSDLVQGARLLRLLKHNASSAIAISSVCQGYAWSGGGRGIVRVDVSADGGATWHTAQLAPPKDQPLHRYAQGYDDRLYRTLISASDCSSRMIIRVCVYKRADSGPTERPESCSKRSLIIRAPV